MEHGGVRIDWTGHDGFRLAGTRTVYVDPFRSLRGIDVALLPDVRVEILAAA